MVTAATMSAVLPWKPMCAARSSPCIESAATIAPEMRLRLVAMAAPWKATTRATMASRRAGRGAASTTAVPASTSQVQRRATDEARMTAAAKPKVRTASTTEPPVGCVEASAAPRPPRTTHAPTAIWTLGSSGAWARRRRECSLLGDLHGCDARHRVGELQGPFVVERDRRSGSDGGIESDSSSSSWWVGSSHSSPATVVGGRSQRASGPRAASAGRTCGGN